MRIRLYLRRPAVNGISTPAGRLVQPVCAAELHTLAFQHCRLGEEEEAIRQETKCAPVLSSLRAVGPTGRKPWSRGLWSLIPRAPRAFTGRTIPLTVREADCALAPFMKVVSSIKSAKKRHPACQVVRRKGKIYVINKVEPRYKARQG